MFRFKPSLCFNWKTITQLTPCATEGRRAVFLLGEVMGYSDGETCLEAMPSKERIVAEALTGKQYLNTIRWSVGSFILIVISQKEISITTSPAGPGGYYVEDNGDLVFTTDEKEMANLAAKSGLGEMDVLHNLFAKPAPVCPPFTTIFNKGFRLPGGAEASISNTLKINKRIYIQDAPRLAPHSYDRFRTIFDDTTRLMCTATKHRPLYATVSGGIDSAAVLLSAKSAGFAPPLLHWRKADNLSGSVQYMADICGLPLEFLGRNYGLPDPLKHDPEKAASLYSSALGVIGFNQMLTGMAGIDGAFLTGMAFGNILQINVFMRNCFGETRAQRQIRDARLRKPKRSIYSSAFLAATRKGYAKQYLELVAKITGEKAEWKAPDNINEFLKYLTYTNETPYLGASQLNERFKEFDEEYWQYVMDKIHAPILGKSLGERLLRGDGNMLSDAEVWNTSRKIRYSLQVQRTSHNDRLYAAFGGYEILSPPMEGSILSYCMTRPIRTKDILSPKHFLFRYFKEKVGMSYGTYIEQDRHRMAAEQDRDYGGGPKENEQLGNYFQLVYESSGFKKLFKENINTKDSALLSLLPEGNVRDSMAKFYADYSKQADVFWINNQLLNIEIFLRNNT